METLGSRLKDAREKKRLTQVQVAEKLGISNGTLSGYERNYRDPDTNILAKLARMYDVSTDYLTTGIEKGESKVEETEADFKRKKGLEYISKIKDEKTLDLAIELLEKLAKE